MDETFFGEWEKLGIAFNTVAIPQTPDPEKLIVETTHQGRQHPRLLSALLTWLIHFGDLINTKRLIKMVPKADAAVLGAVTELALEQGADEKLKHIKKRCVPNQTPEILFPVMEEKKVTKIQETEESMPLFIQWGLFCSSLDRYDDAVSTREKIFKQNPLLALRAIFGTGARAEILFWLLKHSKDTIKAISKGIGISYQPIYAEVQKLLRSSIAQEEVYGRVRVISLPEKTKTFLKTLPIA